jgi:hypothetical protein
MNKKSPNRKYLTERNLASLRPKAKQYLVWDSADGQKKGGDDPARGLAVLVSPTGTKSFRCAFYYPGSDKTQYKHLGRVGEMTLQEARTQCREVRRMAGEGDDPKSLETHTDHFAEALRRYIENEQQGRRENKSASKTKAVIDRATPHWQDPHRPRILSTIRYAEIEALLEEIRDGDKENGTKARPYISRTDYTRI